jgi:hypothetical protein
MSSYASEGIYSDDLISATELNRQPGQVLDRALLHPVTITRNDQAFALLRREDMANLVKVSAGAEIVVEIISVAYRLGIGEKVGWEHPYGWLSVFDTEELSEFVAEIVDAFRRASVVGDGEILDAIIHEWHESAICNSSPELAAAMNAEVDEVPLTHPTATDSTHASVG